jgi:phage repressor protein C with HTH and peptisase S24 domain
VTKKERHSGQHKDGWLRDKNNALEIQSRDKIKKDWANTSGINYLELNEITKPKLFRALEAELIRLAERVETSWRTCFGLMA